MNFDSETKKANEKKFAGRLLQAVCSRVYPPSRNLYSQIC